MRVQGDVAMGISKLKLNREIRAGHSARACDRHGRARIFRMSLLAHAVATSISVLVTGGAAAAETAADSVETLEDFVITARNRAEAAQSVPLPTSVVGSKDLERDNATTSTDFARL